MKDFTQNPSQHRDEVEDNARENLISELEYIALTSNQRRELRAVRKALREIEEC